MSEILLGRYMLAPDKGRRGKVTSGEMAMKVTPLDVERVRIQIPLTGKRELTIAFNLIGLLGIQLRREEGK